MLVSILIPCFNARELVAQCIESALAQTWPDKEIIVVDDGSTDGSLDVIRSFDGRIRWETGPNRGGNAARNRLLELAGGEWLQYLDADDYLRPGKIQGQMNFVAQHPGAEVVVSPTIWEKTQDGKLVWVENTFKPPCDPWVMLAHWLLPQTGGPLFRRSALQRVGGWRIGQPCCQEHELYGRLLQAGFRFEFFDECLAVYRDWDHSIRLTQKLSGEVDRQRLLIIARMEKFLGDTSELTGLRRQAINDARLQVARKIWTRDEAAALAVARQIDRSDPSFCPSDGPARPSAYRLAYRLFGFAGAQRVADCARKVGSLVAERAR